MPFFQLKDFSVSLVCDEYLSVCNVIPCCQSFVHGWFFPMDKIDPRSVNNFDNFVNTKSLMRRRFFNPLADAPRQSRSCADTGWEIAGIEWKEASRIGDDGLKGMMGYARIIGNHHRSWIGSQPSWGGAHS